jgi:hypothetical protein
MTVTPLYPAEKYTYRVVWSEDDRQYVGVCSEFPSLSHLAGSHDDALDGIIGLVRDALADMVRSRREPPVPSAVRLAGGSTDRG